MRGFEAAVLVFLALGCATEIHRGSCACELVEGPTTCRLEQETHTFKRRPILERLFDAIGGLVGWMVP